MFRIAVLAALCSIRSCGTQPSGIPQSPVRGADDFAVELFAVLCSADTGANVCISPFSISSAMAMTWAGARGETEAQMALVLGFTMPQGDLHASYAELLGALTSRGTSHAGSASDSLFRLEIANAVWAEASFPLLDSFIDIAGECYGAAARNVDFAGSPEDQRAAVNRWVEETTEGRIQDLLAPGSVTADTKLIVTNAVYFKGGWEHTFDSAATSTGSFTTGRGATIEVPMMHQVERLPFARSPECVALSLPYMGGSCSMVVLLPEDGDVNLLMSGMSAEDLETLRSSMRPTKVSLAMPSFEFSSSHALEEVLPGMGMTDAFSPGRADFSGMTGSRDLFIGAVVHKAFVKVDEAGTEAAAATAVELLPTCAPPVEEVVEVVLDRPFAFIIADDASGTILFIGRLSDPSSR